MFIFFFSVAAFSVLFGQKLSFSLATALKAVIIELHAGSAQSDSHWPMPNSWPKSIGLVSHSGQDWPLTALASIKRASIEREGEREGYRNGQA